MDRKMLRNLKLWTILWKIELGVCVKKKVFIVIVILPVIKTLQFKMKLISDISTIWFWLDTTGVFTELLDNVLLSGIIPPENLFILAGVFKLILCILLSVEALEHLIKQFVCHLVFQVPARFRFLRFRLLFLLKDKLVENIGIGLLLITGCVTILKPWNKPPGNRGQFAFQNCAWFSGIWHEPGAIPNEPGPIYKIQFNITRT